MEPVTEKKVTGSDTTDGREREGRTKGGRNAHTGENR